MKIKTFSITGYIEREWEDTINEFLKGKKVEDVKLTSYLDEDGTENHTVLVMYQ